MIHNVGSIEAAILYSATLRTYRSIWQEFPERASKMKFSLLDI